MKKKKKRKKASFLANYLTRKKNDGFFRLFEQSFPLDFSYNTIATFLAIALFDKKGEHAVFSFLNVELVTDLLVTKHSQKYYYYYLPLPLYSTYNRKLKRYFFSPLADEKASNIPLKNYGRKTVQFLKVRTKFGRVFPS